MKNKKILIGLSSCALMGATLIGCGGSKGTDTPKVHVFANTQTSYFKDSVYVYDSNGDLIKDEDGKAVEETVPGWHKTSHLTDNVISYGLTDSNKKLEYGKDVDMTIEAKDFCLLANYKNKAYEENNFLTPYQKGYATPFVGYGNGLGDRHALPLNKDFYTYKQDAENPQKFYLHINGEAFKHNIVVDFDYTEKLSDAGLGGGKQYVAIDTLTSNAPTVISTQYEFYHDDNDYWQYYQDDNLNGDFILNDGFVFVVYLRAFDDWSPSYYSTYTTKDGDVLGSKLYNFENFEKGKDIKIYGYIDGKRTDLNSNDYKFEISSDKEYAYVTIPWEKLYNKDTYEPIYNENEGINYEITKKPNTSIDVKTAAPAGSEISVLKSGYGCNPAYISGLKYKATLVDTKSGETFPVHESIFYSPRIARSYRTLFTVDQGASKDIIWPTVIITSKVEGGTPVTTKLSTTDESTIWRIGDKDNPGVYAEVDGETELPYRKTEDGKFVVVCINPEKRTNIDDSTYSGKHNLFALYDYNGKSSYLVGDTDKYATSVSINISK